MWGFLICLFLPLPGSGQFFPIAEATWCAYQDGNVRYRHLLSANPDTIVDGQVYQLARNYICYANCPNWSLENFEYLSTTLIRSSPDGKGHIRGFGDTTEYLVGDLTAAVGDTVPGVLIFGPNWWDWDFSPARPTYSVVVDSIVHIERWGVTVTRHFVHELTVWNADVSSSFDPRKFFWQQGMGTSHGLVLRMDAALGGYYALDCAMTGDSTVFSWYFPGPDLPPWGYPPGGPACCAPWDVGIGEHLFNQRFVSENPSTGLFRLNTTAPIAVEVFDAQGRAIAAIRANELDLSAHPPGLYTAVVTTAQGRQAIRLMVVR
ncbi:MAG TPA: T9SS type A sorting domain-containing protein [Flavobacteriales bacterium]|nr:T9SS type A sorting domain-containing protein [Flavobacteriales bacterium]